MKIRIDGALDFHQSKSHIPHAFTLPVGTARLDIRFDYAPMHTEGQPVQNDLSLTLFDPNGARGARHCNPDRNLSITANQATVGYLPGLEPGVWTVWIDAHRIMPAETIHYWLEIETTDQPINETNPLTRLLTSGSSRNSSRVGRVGIGAIYMGIPAILMPIGMCRISCVMGESSS